MGLLFSCPADDSDLAMDDGLLPPPAPPAPPPAAEPAILRALGSGKLLIEGSLSFKREEPARSLHVETKISITAAAATAEAAAPTPRELGNARSSPPAAAAAAAAAEIPKHEAAAVKLQKVYKSFRTRRQLADCAVLVEQSWWKLLDFALLKRSSVSFFDIEKQESAVSRWSRARTRAAKVGKGLSKDEKAQKLALQHWLEAIDPRHRYGHNLHRYYDCWLNCESKQPFFYWLDVGEGKEVNLEERCPRWKLQQQCIKYLGPKEREDYEVVIEDGIFLHKKSREILDTSGGSRDSKWIFVLSTSKNLYVGQKNKGTFQHSSFLAGGATSAAGRLVVENGSLKAIWPHSGHYRPTEENFQEFKSFLRENSVDLTDVKMSPAEEDEEFWGRLRSIPSEHYLSTSTDKPEDDTAAAEKSSPCRIPETTETAAEERQECQEVKTEVSASEGTENTEVTSTRDQSLSDGEQEDGEEAVAAVVPRELILRRINSKKGMKSYQLGKQLSFKWTTGAGPRIGCVRDYPPELQFRALEQVNLSPRSAGASRFAASGSFNSSPMARGSSTNTPREAFRTHLHPGQVICDR